MLKVGDKFPIFNLKGVLSHTEMTFPIFSNQNQWQVFFFWPKDFTFVCPTEIAEFAALNDEFKARETQIFGVSIDSEYVHLAWREQNPMLRHAPFPMLADVKRELSVALGILDEEQGVAQRATFIVDPEGAIRFAMMTDMNVGRNPKEVLRVLDALQTKELCGCNWEKGEATLVHL